MSQVCTVLVHVTSLTLIFTIFTLLLNLLNLLFVLCFNPVSSKMFNLAPQRHTPQLDLLGLGI